MKVYALVGPSGTGKSYRAINLASEKGIYYIIDDGLFIKGNRVIAGTSAKKEPTKLAAVRRAVFMDPDHARVVREAIERVRPEALLILGTSIGMVNRIIERLQLPPVCEVFRIEDIATEREIKMALRKRQKEGKHIIPVPTFEIKKDFSGYFIHPLRIFRTQKKSRKIEALEKTVVRPTYSYMGRFYIYDSVIESIAAYNASYVEGISKVLKAEAVSAEDGVVIYIETVVYYGIKIHEALKKVQKAVASDVSRLTGLSIKGVNVAARGIVLR